MSLRAVASLSEKGEADKARFRRAQKGLTEFARQERAYLQGQYRWTARQHAKLQSAVKKAAAQLKAELQEEDGWCDEPCDEPCGEPRGEPRGDDEPGEDGA